MPKKRYSVYVIELSKRVWTENARFRKANPQYFSSLECLYVGMTSKSPYERFDQHVLGIKSKRGHSLSSAIVKKYGMYLRHSMTTHLDLMTQKEAMAMEENLALILRRKRYAVWYN